MTLRELINSVDSEQYDGNPLYQKLCNTIPEYGTSRHIQVNVANGDIILKEIENDGFTDDEQEDFWDDFDNLQKAKIIR